MKTDHRTNLICMLTGLCAFAAFGLNEEEAVLRDKVAIITAGGSSIGAAAACRLASGGFRVAIFDTSDKAEALAKELGGFAVTGSNQSNDDLMLIFPSHAHYGPATIGRGIRFGNLRQCGGCMQRECAETKPFWLA